MKLSFFVQGKPIAQGSKRHVGGGILVESAKGLPEWRKAVAYTARAQVSDPHDGPVMIRLHFYFDRPKTQMGTGRNAGRAKGTAPRFHTSYPDVDKLCRAVLDALTGVAFTNDSHVFSLMALKSYSTAPGVRLLGQGQGVNISIEGVP